MNKHSAVCNSKTREISEISNSRKMPEEILLHTNEGIVYNC